MCVCVCVLGMWFVLIFISGLASHVILEREREREMYYSYTPQSLSHYYKNYKTKNEYLHLVPMIELSLAQALHTKT